MQNLQGNPNIVKLKEVIRNDQIEAEDGSIIDVDTAMLMEGLGGGELGQNMEKYGCLSPGLAHNFICQVLNSVSYLKHKGIAHMNIHPGNLMLNEDQTDLKLIGF